MAATGALLKAAHAKLGRKEKVGGADVTVIVRGDFAAVQAAVEAGPRAAAPRWDKSPQQADRGSCPEDRAKTSQYRRLRLLSLY